jgi:hypothetical protein
MPATRPLAKRISNKTTIDDITGCHNWTGSLSSQGKYPTVGAGNGENKPLYVHQVMAGPEPDFPPPDGSSRWEVHHACVNRTSISN